MLSLLILVVFGLAVGFFAAQNTSIVHISLAHLFTGGVPLYVVIIGAMLLGIFVSWLISMVSSISSTLKIHGKDAALKDAYRAIDSLKEENNALLLKITHLKGEQNIPFEKAEEVEENLKKEPSSVHRLTHSYT